MLPFIVVGFCFTLLRFFALVRILIFAVGVCLLPAVVFVCCLLCSFCFTRFFQLRFLRLLYFVVFFFVLGFGYSDLYFIFF